MKKILLILTLALCTPMTFAQTLPSYVSADGLVGYWPFNGNANDESGNGNNGIVTGALLSSDRDLNANSCYNFNVNNWTWGSGGDEIYIPFNSSFNSSSISVSTWFMKTSDGTQGQGLTIINRFQYGYSNPDGETFLLRMEPPNQYAIEADILSAGTNINDQSGIANLGPYIQLNTWTHAVFTFDGFILKLYINGVLISSNSSSGFSLNTNGNSGISIGVSDQANGHWGPFDGKIDDIGIWNRALTQEEITLLYTATPAPEEVAIGTQTWTTKNLDIATYSDGTTIPEVQNLQEWASLTTGAWCYYNNDPINGNTYGKLYNWYAVAGIWNEASKTDTTLRKSLVPIDWHVPSDDEWTTLIDYLGGIGVNGKMKETGTSHWLSPNQDATNSSGFTGLPGGVRQPQGSFGYINYDGWWWSSSESDKSDAWFCNLYYYGGTADKSANNKASGFSVRCVKNTTSSPIASGQTFCGAATVASLVATGTDLKWYATETGGTALVSDVALASGKYYVSQTLNTIESDRSAVTVSINEVQITASATVVCRGEVPIISIITNQASNILINPGDRNQAIHGSSFEYSLNTPTQNWQTEIGIWNTGYLPFVGINTGALPNSTYWPLGTTCYLRKQIDLTNYDLSTIHWNIAVDNGYTLYVNGNPVSNSFEGGPAIEWEYQGTFQSNMLHSGINNIAIKIVDDGAGAASFNFLMKGEPVSPTYLWSTGETTATINPSPTATTTYWCDVTFNGVKCRKEITINVYSSTSAPTAVAQTLCTASTVANLVATGTDLKWYALESGETALASDVALVSGTYYVSQTINGCESKRTAVAVSVNDTQITASATMVSSGTAVRLNVNNLNATSSLIESFSMNMFQPFNHITPLLEKNNNYILKASGTVGFAGNINSQDAAYQYNWFGSPLTPYPFLDSTHLWWYINGSNQYRPDNNMYSSDHIYYFSFTGNGSPLQLSWTDNPYSDNSGQLNFELIKVDNTTYRWSTGETTATINPTPSQTTTYWCDVTINGATCRKEITINVGDLGTEENTIDLKIKVYPNPTSQLLYVSHPEQKNFSIRITDLSGKQMYSGTITTAIPLDIAKYPQGMYLVSIGNAATKKKSTYKIIKK